MLSCISNKKEYAAYFGGKAVAVDIFMFDVLKNAEPYSGEDVVYKLYSNSGLSIFLLRSIKKGSNDFFIVNGKKYEFLKTVSDINKPLIYEPKLGVFNTTGSKYYLVKTSKRKYFILESGCQGASGNMAGLNLFFIVDYTDTKNLITYSLQNWTDSDFSFLDIDNDGYMDFSYFKDLNDPKHIEITNYSLKTGRVILKNNRKTWNAEWKGNCLFIK